ncbi:hypothetical protein KKA15_07140 [Patescibacteria group bacterium]|nr:hypothetical protein [Patescibacteria group bacterium]
MPQLNWKRIALIAGFIAVVILLGWFLYYVFFSPTTQTNQNINQNINGGLINADPGGGTITNINGTGSLPGGINGNVNVVDQKPQQTLPSEIAAGGLTQVQNLSEANALGVTLSSDGNNLVYYDPMDGKFYRLTSNGEKTLLSDKTFFAVENIVWSNEKNEAIIEYPDGANILYNFDTKTQVTLPRHWQDFSFSTDNEKVVTKSLGTNPENRFLIVSKPDGSQAKSITLIGENEDIVNVDWAPNNQVIATYTKAVDGNRQELFFVGLNDENFKSIIIAGWNFEGIWSPKGDKILYSVSNAETENKPQLYIVDALGQRIGLNLKNLKTQTWANKCTFADNDTVYCAIPTQLETGAGFNQEIYDEYPDTILKINLLTGYKSILAIPEIGNTINKLMVSNNNQYLFYQDKFTNKIFKIKLR